MPVSAFMPDITVEIAFDSTPDDPAPVWTDVSQYVEAAVPITISRGRSDELSEVQPSRLKVTLDNSDGRFTPGNAASPYYPNVRLQRKIRVSATPVAPVSNLVANPSAEVDTTAWSVATRGFLTRDTSTAAHGAASFRYDSDSTDVSFLQVQSDKMPVTAGLDYTLSVFLKEGATFDSVKTRLFWFDSAGAQLSESTIFFGLTSAWTPNSFTATAPANATDVAINLDFSPHSSIGHAFFDAVILAEGDTVEGVPVEPLAPPTTHRRFTGYVDEWPVQWPDGTDEYATTTVTASSRRARLAVGTELRSIIEEEYLLDAPVAYYPLGETFTPPAPGMAGDVSGNQQFDLVATGPTPGIQWAAATGPGTDGMSSPVFNDGRWLEMTATEPLIDDTFGSFTLEAFINTTDSGTARTAAVIFASDDAYTRMGIESDGRLTAAVFQSNVATVLTSVATVNDGLTHHVAIRQDLGVDGFTIDATLFLDGVAVDSFTIGHDLEPFFEHRRLVVGALKPTSVSRGWVGTISHVALTANPDPGTALSDARILNHANSGLTGFEGEPSNNRVNRFAGYVNVSLVTAELGSVVSMAAQETTGKTAIALMDEVIATEGGLLFDAPDGSLTFHGRSHRYNAASQFTLDAGLQQIGSSVEAKMDGQQLVNDITASRPEGATIRVTNPDSITEHGARREQIELLTTSDSEVVDAANWRVQQYGEPDVRIHSVSVDLINMPSALITSLLDAELGDKVTLSNLPDQAPDTSMDVFVDGIAETIGAESYTIGFELTPATPFEVWELDSATRSQLDETTVLAY